MYLIVGLGNPGHAYENTRHNIGWEVLLKAASRWSIPLKDIGSCRQGEGKVGHEPVRLCLPLTWMNRTGWVVKEVVDVLGVSTNQIIVVYDDLDLDAGRLRIKLRGGSGGHNGIRSLIAALGTQEFTRVKVGIGRPAPGQDPADYVLSPFAPTELPVMANATDQAVLALECLITKGAEVAMNAFH